MLSSDVVFRIIELFTWKNLDKPFALMAFFSGNEGKICKFALLNTV